MALLSTSYSVSKAQVLEPGQVSTTGNIVTPTTSSSGTTWYNAVYQDALTCWAWGNPGYCGPNAIVGPSNNLNFSYGTTDVYQIKSIASVLPNSGSGLQVNGYNFSFMAKNGNGWDDGRVDYLMAYAHFSDPANTKSMFYKTYNLNYKFDWTAFNFSETFTNPLATSSLGNVTYGFIGRDNNYWAGPYGPEIYGISFSLKYSVDPCYVSVFSSPACPGYLDAIAKLTPATSSSVVVDTPSNTVIVSADSSPVAVEPKGTISAPAIVSEPVSQPVSAATTPGTSNTTGPSLSTILNIVRSEQARVSAVESSTVKQANEAAAVASSQAQQQAQDVAASAVANSQQSQQSVTSGTVIASVQTRSQNNFSLELPSTLQTSVVNISTVRGPQNSLIESTSNAQAAQILAPITQLQEVKKVDLSSQQDTEVPRSTAIALTGHSVIKDYLDQKQVEPSQNESSKQAEVKRVVSDNEIAGGVNLAMLQRMPPGYELYTTGLRDAAFYPPKEVYKNQKVIDNQRVLRQLNSRSDLLHEEMVNAQYR